MFLTRLKYQRNLEEAVEIRDKPALSPKPASLDSAARQYVFCNSLSRVFVKVVEVMIPSLSSEWKLERFSLVQIINRHAICSFGEPFYSYRMADIILP
jgi:hypothetical protein